MNSDKTQYVKNVNGHFFIYKTTKGDIFDNKDNFNNFVAKGITTSSYDDRIAYLPTDQLLPPWAIHTMFWNYVRNVSDTECQLVKTTFLPYVACISRTSLEPNVDLVYKTIYGSDIPMSYGQIKEQLSRSILKWYEENRVIVERTNLDDNNNAYDNDACEHTKDNNDFDESFGQMDAFEPIYNNLKTLEDELTNDDDVFLVFMTKFALCCHIADENYFLYFHQKDHVQNLSNEDSLGGHATAVSDFYGGFEDPNKPSCKLFTMTIKKNRRNQQQQQQSIIGGGSGNCSSKHNKPTWKLDCSPLVLHEMFIDFQKGYVIEPDLFDSKVSCAKFLVNATLSDSLVNMDDEGDSGFNANKIMIKSTIPRSETVNFEKEKINKTRLDPISTNLLLVNHVLNRITTANSTYPKYDSKKGYDPKKGGYVSKPTLKFSQPQLPPVRLIKEFVCCNSKTWTEQFLSIVSYLLFVQNRRRWRVIIDNDIDNNCASRLLEYYGMQQMECTVANNKKGSNNGETNVGFLQLCESGEWMTFCGDFSTGDYTSPNRIYSQMIDAYLTTYNEFSSALDGLMSGSKKRPSIVDLWNNVFDMLKKVQQYVKRESHNVTVTARESVTDHKKKIFNMVGRYSSDGNNLMCGMLSSFLTRNEIYRNIMILIYSNRGKVPICISDKVSSIFSSSNFGCYEKNVNLDPCTMPIVFVSTGDYKSKPCNITTPSNPEDATDSSGIPVKLCSQLPSAQAITSMFYKIKRKVCLISSSKKDYCIKSNEVDMLSAIDENVIEDGGGQLFVNNNYDGVTNSLFSTPSQSLLSLKQQPQQTKLLPFQDAESTDSLITKISIVLTNIERDLLPSVQISLKTIQKRKKFVTKFLHENVSSIWKCFQNISNNVLMTSWQDLLENFIMGAIMDYYGYVVQTYANKEKIVKRYPLNYSQVVVISDDDQDKCAKTSYSFVQKQINPDFIYSMSYISFRAELSSYQGSGGSGNSGEKADNITDTADKSSTAAGSGGSGTGGGGGGGGIDNVVKNFYSFDISNFDSEKLKIFKLQNPGMYFPVSSIFAVPAIRYKKKEGLDSAGSIPYFVKLFENLCLLDSYKGMLQFMYKEREVIRNKFVSETNDCQSNDKDDDSTNDEYYDNVLRNLSAGAALMDVRPIAQCLKMILTTGHSNDSEFVKYYKDIMSSHIDYHNDITDSDDGEIDDEYGDQAEENKKRKNSDDDANDEEQLKHKKMKN